MCVESILKNSSFRHQLIVHVNEGSEGSLDWVKSQGLDFTYSEQNAGVCFSLNAAASLARTDYIVFMNDDMYVLPGWDEFLWKEIEAAGSDYFFFSGTMIEPCDTGNACVLAPFDFGGNVGDFREKELLEQQNQLTKMDWQGATWPPNVVHRRLWELVGGYSVEFSPGMSSDPDFSMKLWQAGVRLFKGVGAAKVYHFQAKSTQKITKNDGNSQFLQKWGITQSTFFKYFLRRGTDFDGPLKDTEEDAGLRKARLKSRIKRKFL